MLDASSVWAIRQFFKILPISKTDFFLRGWGSLFIRPLHLFRLFAPRHHRHHRATLHVTTTTTSPTDHVTA